MTTDQDTRAQLEAAIRNPEEVETLDVEIWNAPNVISTPITEVPPSIARLRKLK